MLSLFEALKESFPNPLKCLPLRVRANAETADHRSTIIKLLRFGCYGLDTSSSTFPFVVFLKPEMTFAVRPHAKFAARSISPSPTFVEHSAVLGPANARVVSPPHQLFLVIANFRTVPAYREAGGIGEWLSFQAEEG